MEKKGKKKYSGITISSPSLSEGGGTRAEMQVFEKKKTEHEKSILSRYIFNSLNNLSHC